MLIYKNDESIEEDTYPQGTEISFNCIASISGEKTTWKLICEDGAWIGRSSECGDDENGMTPLANGSCIFRNSDPHVASFYNDLEVRENYVEFPAATTIISRYIYFAIIINYFIHNNCFLIIFSSNSDTDFF